MKPNPRDPTGGYSWALERLRQGYRMTRLAWRLGTVPLWILRDCDGRLFRNHYGHGSAEYDPAQADMMARDWAYYDPSEARELRLFP